MSGWISVKDSLPDDGEDVLCFFKQNEESRIIPTNYYKGVWFDCVFDCSLNPLCITHWMPLPKPPEERHDTD